MRVLVTGSSGFIGRRLVQHLAAEGHAVVGLDLVSASGLPARTIICDVRDAESLREAMASVAPHVVLHLAARTDLDGHTATDYNTNTAGVSALIVAMQHCETVRRCIFTSTQLVGPPGVALSDDMYAPTTPYGASKAEGERIVRRWLTSIEWCIVRPTTVWGPGMNQHYQRLFRHIERGTYFHVGRTQLEKSYGYVGNVAHQYAALALAAAEDVNQQTFYLADYVPLNLREWTEGLRKHLNAPQIRTLPIPIARALAWSGDALSAAGWRAFPFTSFRLSNILSCYQVDTTGLRRVCGELPYDMQTGIEETVDWLRSLRLAADAGRPGRTELISNPLRGLR